MPNTINLEKVEQLREKVKNAKSIAVVDYQGFKSNDINSFRRDINKQDAETVITKNTLLKLALEEEGVDTKNLTEDLTGLNAAIFSYKDPVAYLKTIHEYFKRLEIPKVKFALIEKVFTSAADVKTISELPAKEQLLAQVVGGLKSPLSGLVNVLGGTQRNLVTVLSRIADNKN